MGANTNVAETEVALELFLTEDVVRTRTHEKNIDNVCNDPIANNERRRVPSDSRDRDIAIVADLERSFKHNTKNAGTSSGQ